MRKHAIHQVRRGIGHATSATGRTNKPAFARQRLEPILAARFTLESQKAAGQDFARQVCPHLAFDKLRDLAAASLLASEKAFQMARDRPIQQRGFRIPWPILIFLIRSGSNTRVIRSGHGRPEACRTPPIQFDELTEDTDACRQSA